MADTTASSSSSRTIAIDDSPKPASPFKKDRRFWLIFLSLCVSCFLSALDLTSISTALPVMAQDLNSSEYSWVGSSYALTSTAFIPWTGGFAAIFGRRPTTLASLALFAIGSAICGAAPTMDVVIIGRAIQGVGGGGILTEIIVVDLLPLAERGAFFGIIGSVWAISSAIGPPIGGAFASAGQWRWLFYMNLPIAAVAMLLVGCFLRVKTPETTWKKKLAQMDYANVIFVAGSTSTILGLTWAGGAYSWDSVQVLAPLILGLAGMAAFIFVEKTWVKHPTVPFDILTHSTSLIGFFTTFLHGLLVMAVVYYLPVYFQSALGDSPIQSGVDLFSICFTIAPFAIITGASVTISGHYKIQNVVGWGFIAVGFGLITLLKADSPKAAWAGYPIVLGIGLGILYAGTTFPVLAPLKPEQQPHAMAFHAFTRSFGQVFGITIGSTILRSQLAKDLPRAFFSQFGQSIEIAYAAIPVIASLAEPLRTEVRVAFVDALRLIWQVMLGLTALGFLASLGMQSIKLVTETDSKWGLHEKERVGDVELGEGEKVEKVEV